MIFLPASLGALKTAAAGGGGSGSTTTWSTTDKTATVALSDVNMTATCPNDGNNKGIRSSVGFTSAAKVYWELQIGTAGSTTQGWRGIKRSTANLIVTSSDQASITPAGSIQASAGLSNGIGTPLSYTSGDVLMFAFDGPNDKLYIGKNGTFMASGNPAANSGGAITGFNAIGGTWHAFTGLGDFQAQTVTTLNCGATAFTYTPPSGFSAL